MTKRRAPPPPPRLEDLLCFLVHSTGFAFTRVYRRQLEQLGLTYPQYLAMVVLWAEDGLTVGQIGERVKLDSGTLTPLLKRLEGLGLVSRTRSPEDERRVVVRLTAKGSELRDRAGEVMRGVARAVGMEAGEVSSIMRQMRVMRDNLESAVGLEASLPAGSRPRDPAASPPG